MLLGPIRLVKVRLYRMTGHECEIAPLPDEEA